MLALALAGTMTAGCSNAAPSGADVSQEMQEPAGVTEEEPKEEAPAESEAAPKEEKAEEKEPAKTEEEIHGDGLSVNVEKEFVSRTDDESKVIAYGHYPVLKVSGKDCAGLASALDSLTEKLKKDVEGNLDEIAGFAKDDIKDGRELPGGYYTYNCDALVTRADEKAFSVLLTYDTFSGGAHPTSWYETHVYDSKTGDELNIGNVAQDTDALPKLLADRLLSEYDKETFFDENVEGMIREAWEDEGNYVFTLDNSGICFYFSAYQIAPYAAGSQIVTFPYADNKDLVKPEYAADGGDAIEGIVPQKKYMISGKKVSFAWYANYEDDYEYEFNISVDGTESTENLTCAGMQPYLVSSKGQYYIYVNELQMNDYQSLDIYTVNGSGLKKAGTFDRGFRSVSPTDPAAFDLAGRTDLLSTNNTYRSYHVGDNGIPAPNEEYDHVIGSVSEKLTLKKDIEADVFADENASESEKVKLTKGTVLYYFRTDDETFMDMKMEDGRIVRFFPKTGDWPQTIDGTDIEEIFDGVMFAG